MCGFFCVFDPAGTAEPLRPLVRGIAASDPIALTLSDILAMAMNIRCSKRAGMR